MLSALAAITEALGSLFDWSPRPLPKRNRESAFAALAGDWRKIARDIERVSPPQAQRVQSSMEGK